MSSNNSRNAFNLSRRTLLKGAAGAAALGATSFSPLGFATGGCQSMTPTAYGVQLFMFRDDLVRDMKGTLTKLAEAGFSQVELFGIGGFPGIPSAPYFGSDLAGWVETLSALKLEVPTGHLNGPVADPASLLPMAEKLNMRYFIEPMAEELLSFDTGKPVLTIPETRADVMKIAERLNKRGKTFANAGLKFGYHNHHFEFARVEDSTVLALLMENTDPEYVKLELDLGWTAIAGESPIEQLNKYGDRVIACHMKDVKEDAPLQPDNPAMMIPEMAKIRTPGGGDLNYKDIVATLDKLGVEFRFIEVDVTASPLADAKAGLQYLQGIC